MVDRVEETGTHGSWSGPSPEGKGQPTDCGGKLFHHSGGVTYFSKGTERFVFFVLTMIMLLWGFAERFGLLGG